MALVHYELARGTRAQAGPQHLDLAAELFPLLGLAHGHRHFVGAERLVKVVVGAFPHGGERAVLAAVRAHHDEERLPTLGAVPPEEGHPIHLRHLHIAEDEIEGLRRGAPEGLLGIALARDVVPRLLQQERERLAEPRLIINDQQAHRSHPREAGRL